MCVPLPPQDQGQRESPLRQPVKEQAAEVTVKNVIRCFNISAKCYEIYIVTMTDADESGLLLNHVKSLFCQRDFCDTVS